MGVFIGYAMLAALFTGLFVLLSWICGVKNAFLIYFATAALTVFTRVAELLIKGGQL